MRTLIHATIPTMDLRLVFMGSPDFALPTLRALAERFLIAGIVTQPDRPAGRGRSLSPPPVKRLAQELNLPFIQPQRLSEPEAMDQLQQWSPELIVVAAFGQILRPAVLDLPRFGCLNVHASLLPRWRGAAPIQAAILHGDERTGVTIMQMDPGLDTGPILSQQSLAILPADTAETLSPGLAALGASLLVETLPDYIDGHLLPQPQDDGKATYAPILKKEAGELNFELPARTLVRQVRAFTPWPGSFTSWKGQPLKVHHAREAPPSPDQAAPGTRTVLDGFPAVTTGEGLLVLERVQPAGRRPMGGDVFLQGARGWASADRSRRQE